MFVLQKKSFRWIVYALLIAALLVFSALYALGGSSVTHPTPYVDDHLLDVTDSSLIINLSEVRLVQYADTGSMEPLLFEGATGIEVPVNSFKDLHVGDIVSYQADWIEGLVTHRIVAQEQDGEGMYYTLKGDANSADDLGMVRFSQIKFKLIGVLY